MKEEFISDVIDEKKVSQFIRITEVTSNSKLFCYGFLLVIRRFSTVMFAQSQVINSFTPSL